MKDENSSFIEKILYSARFLQNIEFKLQFTRSGIS